LRDPDDFASTVWLPTSVLVIDAGQDAAALPVGDPCPVATLAAPIPVAPPEDTDRPKIQSAVATPSTIQSGFYLDASTVSVNATDDTGVTRISGSWPAVGFIPAGGTTITGGSGTFTFGPVNWGSTSDYDDKVVPITFVARDAAGNQSAPFVVNVTVHYVLG
jgi:hypothetical protein